MIGNMLSHDWRIYDVGGARSLVSPITLPNSHPRLTVVMTDLTAWYVGTRKHAAFF